MNQVKLECALTVGLIPAETRGQSGSMGSSGVSRGSGLDTQLQQCCKKEEKKETDQINSEEKISYHSYRLLYKRLGGTLYGKIISTCILH